MMVDGAGVTQVMFAIGLPGDKKEGQELNRKKKHVPRGRGMRKHDLLRM